MKGNQRAWRRLAEAALLLPLLAGPLGCQTAGGGQRIRMPILTGPDIAGPFRAATVRERSSPRSLTVAAPKSTVGEDRSLTVAALTSNVPGGDEGPVVPPPVAVDCIDLATALGQAGVENPTIGLAEEAVARASPSKWKRERC